MVKKIIQLIFAPLKYLYLMNNECSDYNSIQTKRKSRTKQRMKKVFLKNSIPTAKSLVFINPFKILNFAKNNPFPLVLKPNFGGYSRGSFFPIKDKKELLRFAFLTKFYWPKTIIEEYLNGKNYRIIVAYGKIIATCERYPPFIIGNNKLTISELIDKENSVREKLKLFPVIYPIKKNTEVINYLKKQNLNLNFIPKKQQKIDLCNKIALAPGGTIVNVELKTITKKNKDLFKKINKLFSANVFGIDVIFEKGINIDYDKQRCIFLEVNSRPYLNFHLFPRFGQKIDVKSEIEKLKNKNECK